MREEQMWVKEMGMSPHQIYAKCVHSKGKLRKKTKKNAAKKKKSNVILRTKWCKFSMRIAVRRQIQMQANQCDHEVFPSKM